GRDRFFPAQQHVSSVEAGIDAHRSYAGCGLAVRDRPLDGRSAAILGQQRCMQIDVAEWRQVEHPIRKKSAISDPHDSQWLCSLKPRAKVLIIFDLLRLSDRNFELLSDLLHRRRNGLHPSAGGPIRLRDDEPNIVASTRERLQCWNGE